MGDITALPRGLHVSIRTLADELGMTRETVAKRIADANVVPSGKKGGHPVYRLKDVVAAVMGNAGTDDPKTLDPYRRQAHYKAELDRLKLETETRQVVPVIEVEQEQARILRLVAQLLDTLPDIVERDCGAAVEIVQRIERALDELRESLYRELADEDADAVRESA